MPGHSSSLLAALVRFTLVLALSVASLLAFIWALRVALSVASTWAATLAVSEARLCAFSWNQICFRNELILSQAETYQVRYSGISGASNQLHSLVQLLLDLPSHVPFFSEHVGRVLILI